MKPMKILNKFILRSYDVFQVLGAIILAVIMITVMAGIISRYVFNSALSWTEELCTFLMVYLAYTTAPLATISKEHVVADFIKSLLPKKMEKPLSFFIRIFEIAFFIITCISCIHLIPKLTWMSAVLDIPRAAYYAPILVGSIFMIFAIIVDLLNDLFPGYDYFRQRHEAREAEALAQEKAEAQEMLQSVDSFMDEIEGKEKKS